MLHFTPRYIKGEITEQEFELRKKMILSRYKTKLENAELEATKYYWDLNEKPVLDKIDIFLGGNVTLWHESRLKEIDEAKLKASETDNELFHRLLKLLHNLDPTSLNDIDLHVYKKMIGKYVQ